MFVKLRHSLHTTPSDTNFVHSECLAYGSPMTSLSSRSAHSTFSSGWLMRTVVFSPSDASVILCKLPCLNFSLHSSNNNPPFYVHLTYHQTLSSQHLVRLYGEYRHKAYPLFSQFRLGWELYSQRICWCLSQWCWLVKWIKFAKPILPRRIKQPACAVNLYIV